jgi:hypothetical protein
MSLHSADTDDRGDSVMPCPHSSYGSPATCSQCAAAPARRVEISDGIVTVDSQPVRPLDHGSSYVPRRRGGGRK